MTHTSKSDSQTIRKNNESKCSKRRVEITVSENIIYPVPKKRKMSTDQKVNECMSDRVTRSKTNTLKSNISNISENNGAKTADIREKLTEKNKSKVNIRTIENNLAPTNDNNLTHTPKSDSKTIRKNDKSKCSKGRVEITESENIIYPIPKRKKMSTDHKVNGCIPDRVTRSKTNAETLESNISNINENKTSEAKTAEKVSESDQNVKNEKHSACNDDPKLNIAKENADEKLKQIAVNNYVVGEVVWAKIRGFPAWPARIENIIGGKRLMFRIFWFNDYRNSNVYANQVFKFHSNFEQFSKPFNSHIGLETAAREALMYIASEIKK